MHFITSFYFLLLYNCVRNKKVPAAPLEVQTLACYYWIFHYAKRIFETLFIHSFSHSTMPIFNLFKNCSYYWGFAAFVSYFVNHPLYTPPPLDRAKFALGLAMLAQAGNCTYLSFPSCPGLHA